MHNSELRAGARLRAGFFLFSGAASEGQQTLSRVAGLRRRWLRPAGLRPIFRERSGALRQTVGSGGTREAQPTEQPFARGRLRAAPAKSRVLLFAFAALRAGELQPAGSVSRRFRARSSAICSASCAGRSLRRRRPALRSRSCALRRLRSPGFCLTRLRTGSRWRLRLSPCSAEAAHPQHPPSSNAKHRATLPREDARRADVYILMYRANSTSPPGLRWTKGCCWPPTRLRCGTDRW